MKQLEKLQRVYLLDYSDFDELVNSNFPIFKGNYNFVVEKECSNDSDYLYTNILKIPKYDWEKDDLTRFLNGETKWIGTHTVLNALVAKDLLPEGNYIIRVSW